MRMIKFGEQFQDVAVRQTVLLCIDPPRKQFSVKDYVLLEYYCDEPDCDCRRVVLDVVSSDQPGRIFASIHFGWENSAFYRKWAQTPADARLLKQGVLDPTVLHCDWADLLLDHVREEVLANPKAVARFKKHYAMLKREQRKRAKAAKSALEPPPRRGY